MPPAPGPAAMLARKGPGFAPASPWGLRLPHKFLFLLFLSGLFTLCFGALFLLPSSSRFRRFFLAPRTRQPGLEAAPEVPGRPLAGEQESPPNPAPAAPAPGEEDPGSLAGPRRRKGWRRRAQRPGPREEATPARPQEGRTPVSFDFDAFRSRLRHPVLGTGTRGSEEPRSLAQTQREKVKEVRDSPPPKKKRRSWAAPSSLARHAWSLVCPGLARHTLHPPLSSRAPHLDSCRLFPHRRTPQ